MKKLLLAIIGLIGPAVKANYCYHAQVSPSATVYCNLEYSLLGSYKDNNKIKADPCNELIFSGIPSGTCMLFNGKDWGFAKSPEKFQLISDYANSPELVFKYILYTVSKEFDTLTPRAREIIYGKEDIVKRLLDVNNIARFNTKNASKLKYNSCGQQGFFGDEMCKKCHGFSASEGSEDCERNWAPANQAFTHYVRSLDRNATVDTSTLSYTEALNG